MKLKTFRTVTAAAVVATALASCGTDGGTGAGSLTTPKPITSAAFATVPPVPTTVATTAATVAGGATTPVAIDGEQLYTIRGGDYLFGIAKLYGKSADEIATYNQWAEGTLHSLYPGDTVKIPPGAISVDQTAITTAPTVAASVTPVATSTTVGAGEGGTYVVKAGDALSLIASRNGTTMQAIVDANGWTDGITHPLFPGDSIKLPAKTG